MIAGFNEFTEFAERIEQCDELEDLWRVCESFGRKHGFPRFACAYAERDRLGGLAAPKVRANCSGSRVDVWVTSKLYTRDPVVHRACATSIGFCWGLDYLKGNTTEPRLRRFYRELAASAGRSMYVVPLPRVARGAFGIGVLSNDMGQDEFEAHVAERRGLLTLAMIYADRRMLELQGGSTRSAIGLLPREAECMEWLASGVAAEDAATKMGLSTETFEGYLGSAKRKLGAATLTHAIAIAMRHRLIRP